MALLDEQLASTVLNRATYDTVRRVLTLYFWDGDVATFAGIPRSTWDALLASRSKGQFFNSVLRPLGG